MWYNNEHNDIIHIVQQGLHVYNVHMLMFEDKGMEHNVE